MTIQEQYIELQKSRKIQSSDILKSKKTIAWEFFRNYTNVSNLEKNLSLNFVLYLAPLKTIRGTNMVNWPNGANNEIYVDEIFATNNPKLMNVQLQHEVLHGLSRSNNGQELCFGHQYNKDDTSNYTGLNEATTQMFAEDMSGVRLDENSDYLYSIKNIMRVMKAIFGINDIASQYLNNSNDFDNHFNEVTSFKFEPFTLLMNDVYILSKNSNYNFLNEEQVKELNNKKDKLFDFTTALINQVAQNNPSIINKICDELNDENIQSKLNIQKKELSNSNIHKR